MQLKSVIDNLVTGELNQLGITLDDVLAPEALPRVIRHINLALTDLYSRFSLKKKDLVVDLAFNKDVYLLDSKHAVSNTDSVEDKYLLDSPVMPFEDDLVQIIDIANDLGESVPFNDMVSGMQVYTPVYNQLGVRGEILSNKLYVRYQAKHWEVAEDADLSETTLELPPMFLQALLYYVGWRVMSSQLKENAAVTAAGFARAYEGECLRLAGLGQVNRDQGAGAQENKFLNDGWV